LANEQMSVLLRDARGDAIPRRHYISTLPARQVDGFIILGDDNDIRPSLTRGHPGAGRRRLLRVQRSRAPGVVAPRADRAHHRPADVSRRTWPRGRVAA
jgi:hypothetical protein